VFLFLVKRVFRGIVTLYGVITIVFFIIRLNGNPALLVLGPFATKTSIRLFNEAHGLNGSLVHQYGSFLDGAVHGNFGNSIVENTSALRMMLDALPSTLELALGAFVLGIGSSFVLSLVIQLTGSQRLRSLSAWLGTLTLAIPTFLLGIVLVLLFSVHFHLFPAVGNNGPRSFVLPIVTLGVFEFSLYVRLLNLAFGEQDGQDYIRSANALGLKRQTVVVRYILPNALLPMLTLAGINLGSLIGGTVIAEAVFNWGGAGSLIYSSIDSHDYPIVQVGLIVIAVICIAINILVDFLYTVIDPRIRL
jgi:peptide/nickel transport system permease protein